MHRTYLADRKEIIPILPFALEGRAGVSSDKVQSSVSILLAVYAAGLIAASPVIGLAAGVLQHAILLMKITLRQDVLHY
jgi:hypothetical protein